MDMFATLDDPVAHDQPPRQPMARSYYERAPIPWHAVYKIEAVLRRHVEATGDDLHLALSSDSKNVSFYRGDPDMLKLARRDYVSIRFFHGQQALAWLEGYVTAWKARSPEKSLPANLPEHS